MFQKCRLCKKVYWTEFQFGELDFEGREFNRCYDCLLQLSNNPDWAHQMSLESTPPAEFLPCGRCGQLDDWCQCDYTDDTEADS